MHVARDLTLLKTFGSLSSPDCFKEFLAQDGAQTDIIDQILLSEHSRQYPPSQSYQRLFWKYVIEQLELADEEVDERIYEHYLDLLPPASTSQLIFGPPPPSYVTHFWQSPSQTAEVSTITLLESQTTIESGTTGLRTWRASYILGAWLLDHPEHVQGKRVLELGSGSGFLGILIAQMQLRAACPSAIWLTDINESVLDRCRANVALAPNGLTESSNIRVEKLDWADALSHDPIDQTRFLNLLQKINADVIVGADIVYDTSIISPLIAVLQQALANGRVGMPAVLALTVRRRETFAEFARQAEKDLQIHHITLEPQKDDTVFMGAGDRSSTTSEEVKLMRITLRKKSAS